jgi:single-strand selective monofunctional uracil DNA glycosylase
VNPLALVSRRLAREVGELRFAPPVAHVYNPLDYAQAPHERYLELWGRSPKEVVLVGMNPGPIGMMQTGVPFGEVALARDWLGVEGEVRRPAREHPKRPIVGFACARSEVSGARLWGWAKSRFGTPERFFARFFVWNWCPLAFLAESGANLTPDKLPAAERRALERACDRALAEVVGELGAAHAVGVGAFAEAALRRALGPGTAVRVGRIPHPSPASPAANRGWAEQAESALARAGIALD